MKKEKRLAKEKEEREGEEGRGGVRRREVEENEDAEGKNRRMGMKRRNNGGKEEGVGRRRRRMSSAARQEVPQPLDVSVTVKLCRVHSATP